MEKLTLPARVVKKEDGYLATIDNLSMVGSGGTARDAQDDLVDKFMSWVQSRESQGNLEATLSDAGYAGVEDDTELELEFVE
jgi:ABC-type thiamine transport system substrate-binding protein